MKKIAVILVFSFLFSTSNAYYLAEEAKAPVKVSVSSSKYSINVNIKGIPSGQQTLFVPIKIDTMVLDFDKVALEGLSAQNILAVASTSKDKVGTGIGLIKVDDKGLPPELSLKVLLKQNGEGETSVSVQKVAEEPALLEKGAVINDNVKVSLSGADEIEVIENLDEKKKKKLTLNTSKVTINIQRTSQKEESVFIPLIFDKNTFDIDETFGHAILGPGIAAKSYSSGSLHDGGPGVEIVLSAEAEKDFSVDIDLVPRKSGKGKMVAAFPQKGHTAIVKGPVVEINPTILKVANNPVVLTE